MKNFENITLTSNSTVRKALEIIDAGQMRLALVVDESGSLTGTISDGDIRRALLKGATLEDAVDSYKHTDYIFAQAGDSKDKIINLAKHNQIYQIPIVDKKHKLIGIEELYDLVGDNDKPNTVVLMVGGLGTRLRPLTENKPKPLLEVGNKPILETIIENFSKYGYRNFILSVNYKSEMIEEFFGDGSHFGVHIDYVHETKRMGTAGALSLMESKLTDDFFVMNGDLLTNVNFDHLLNFHEKSSAVGTMCVREYDIQIPYGVVNLNDHLITSIDEKPLHKFYVNAGIYMLNKKALEYIPENEFYDMPLLFEDLIDASLTVVSFPMREYWLDIGELKEYNRANSEYKMIFGDKADE